MEFLALFILFAGFIIGLGAVTVIDIHGFLGRKSSYWTEATTRTHKVTKPLIWLGILLVIIGGILFYIHTGVSSGTYIHLTIVLVLIINGLFLSFRVSPYLLAQEAREESEHLLPQKLQQEITLSFLLSFVGWWGALVLFIAQIVS